MNVGFGMRYNDTIDEFVFRALIFCEIIVAIIYHTIRRNIGPSS